MMKMKRLEIPLLLVVFLASPLFGCASQSSHVQDAQTLAASSAEPAQKPPVYLIRPGDELDIKFFYNPELNETVTVRPDGKISLQLVDEIRAAGKTPPDLDQELTGLYAKELRKPMVTVIVRSFTGQRVYVGGEVAREGMIELPPGMTALQAVFQSGGFLETAQPAESIVIRRGEGNRPVPIRVDLASAVNQGGSGADFQLRPDDVVYVPKSAIAKANQFVNQYIERLILFRGVSFGVNYQINNNNNNN